MPGKRIFALAIVAVCFAPSVCAPVYAQSYPTRPLKMIMPFPPGGPIGTTARLVAEQMASRLGQPVVVEERPGAGATIGMAAAAAADPDGYTLLFGSSGSLAVSPALYPNIKYDPVRSFTPVGMVLDRRPAVRGQSVAAGEHGQGVRDLRQGQSGQAQLRCRTRHAATRRLGPAEDADRN